MTKETNKHITKSIRFPISLLEMLDKNAKLEHRSLSAEVLIRLERSFVKPLLPPDA